jgi:hypothetical protein
MKPSFEEKKGIWSVETSDLIGESEKIEIGFRETASSEA